MSEGIRAELEKAHDNWSKNNPNPYEHEVFMAGAKAAFERCASIVDNAHQCKAVGCDEKEQFVDTAEKIRTLSKQLEEM